MKDYRTEKTASGTGLADGERIPFEIVAAYEDSAARERTVALYQRLEKHLGKDCDFKCAWWGLENLSDARLREQAVSDAAAAKMIIVSVRDQQELPGALKTWCDSWAARRRGHKAALVALVAGTETAGQAKGTLQRVLELLARRTHLDFFLHWFDTRSVTGTVTATKGAKLRPKTAEPSVEKASLRQPMPRWGINE